MYLTVNELRLLLVRRQLRTAQEELASLRRCNGDTHQAERAVIRMLSRVWQWQCAVENQRTNRTLSKDHLIQSLSC